jgi:transposase
LVKQRSGRGFAPQDAVTGRLHLRRLRVVKVVRDEAELVVEVADAQSVKRGRSCGARTRKVHETRRRRVRDLPSLGRPTTLVVQVRRFDCQGCGRRFTPGHPKQAGKIARRLARTLVADVRKLTVRELIRHHGLGWHLIMGVVRAWAKTVAPSGGPSAAGC